MTDTDPVAPEFPEAQRRQVEKARESVALFGPAGHDVLATVRERVLTDRVRVLLAIVDHLAPRGGDRG